MIGSFSVCDLYFSTNSSAAEKAIWAMYFSTSSAVIPIPLSEIVSVLASLSTVIETFNSEGSKDFKIFILFKASHAFDASSLKKISLSEYNHFLMIGKIFSEWIDNVLFLIFTSILRFYHR